MESTYRDGAPTGQGIAYRRRSVTDLLRTCALSLLIGGGAFTAGILLDVALGVENRTVLYSDVFTALIATVLAFGVATHYERLRRADAERLQVAADVNHHVRNALTTVLYSVHVRQDPELVDVTEQAVSRIDWTLREILWDSDQQPSTIQPHSR